MVDFTAPDACVANVLRARRGGRAVRRRHDRLGAAEVDELARAAGVAGVLRAELRDRRGADDALRGRGGAAPRAARRSSSSTTRRSSTRRRARRRRPPRRMGGDVPIHSVRLPGLVAHQEVLLGGRGPAADDPPRRVLARGVRAGRPARARAAGDAAARPDGRARRAPLSRASRAGRAAGERRAVAAPAGRAGGADRRGGVRATDEFLPYWAELWPAATRARGGAARTLARRARRRARLRARRPVARRGRTGADVTALDWAEDAVVAAASRTPPATGSRSRRRCTTGASRSDGAFDLASPPTCSTSAATSSRCSSACARQHPSRSWASPAGPTRPSSSAAPPPSSTSPTESCAFRRGPDTLPWDVWTTRQVKPSSSAVCRDRISRLSLVTLPGSGPPKQTAGSRQASDSAGRRARRVREERECPRRARGRGACARRRRTAAIRDRPRRRGG